MKPEWQKLLDEWQDTTQLMRQATAEFMNGFIQQGMDMWVQFGMTGKLSATNLVNFIREEFLKLTYKQLFAPTFAAVGQGIWGFITGQHSAGTSAASALANLLPGDPLDNFLGLSGLAGLASGGDAHPYRTYMVGERGPELLRMGGQGGRVVPNGAIAGGGDFHLHMNTVITGNGVTRNELVNGLALATNVAVARIKDAKRRGDRSL